MPNDSLVEYAVAQCKANAFYDRYERKGESQHQTHYCPGCGHGNVSKMLARAIDDLGIQNRTILISPVGCSVFGYYYFDVGNVQAAHGRAPAVATGVKRSHPDSIVVSYQGDGDLSAIGSAEILHAANRGENITAIFVNNGIYSMTGGQVAPTTLLGQRSTTTPNGRSALNEGYPLRVSELLSTLEAPVYIERVGLGDNKQIAQAARAIRRAVENQVRGLGFSLVEILSPCPTIWKMTPVEAQHWVRDVMERTYPLGVLCDRTKEAIQVSWLPSYGPEMRSGTSNCHVRLSRALIDSPMVSAPNVLVAMNEPSLRKFAATVRPGGWILYNGDAIPSDCAQNDVHAFAMPFTQLADELGDARITNMVMLGVLLEMTGSLPQADVDAALRRLVKHARWLALDEQALQRGRELYREWRQEKSM